MAWYVVSEPKTKRRVMRQYSDCYDPLSPAEMLVVQTLLAGYTSDNALATQLGIAEQTVGTHMCHIYEKLFICNRVDLCLYALRMGWFDCYGNTPG